MPRPFAGPHDGSNTSSPSPQHVPVGAVVICPLPQEGERAFRTARLAPGARQATAWAAPRS